MTLFLNWLFFFAFLINTAKSRLIKIDSGSGGEVISICKNGQDEIEFKLNIERNGCTVLSFDFIQENQHCTFNFLYDKSRIFFNTSRSTFNYSLFESDDDVLVLFNLATKSSASYEDFENELIFGEECWEEECYKFNFTSTSGCHLYIETDMDKGNPLGQTLSSEESSTVSSTPLPLTPPIVPVVLSSESSTIITNQAADNDWVLWLIGGILVVLIIILIILIICLIIRCRKKNDEDDDSDKTDVENGKTTEDGKTTECEETTVAETSAAETTEKISDGESRHSETAVEPDPGLTTETAESNYIPSPAEKQIVVSKRLKKRNT